MNTCAPSRGDVWMVDLGSPRGHEQGGGRPCLVVSVDLFNHGPSGLVVILPLTSKSKNIPFHIEVNPPEGGLRLQSWIKCDDVRSVSVERMTKKLGVVSAQTLSAVEHRLSILLGL